jgi:hypothetical protein
MHRAESPRMSQACTLRHHRHFVAIRRVTRRAAQIGRSTMRHFNSGSPMKLTSTLVAATLCMSASWAMAVVKPAPAKKPAAVGLAAATPEQLVAAERTLVGSYECEFGQTVSVESNAASPGYIDVKHQKMVYTMKPVASSTGAIRLEDVKGKMLFLQIANKSMLMDVKASKRVVDACIHASQRQAAAN